MPIINITLDLTDAESRLLDRFIAAEGSGQTREQVASRLAFVWLRNQFKAIVDHAYQENLDLTVRIFNQASLRKRLQVFDVLGMEYDGLNARVKPAPEPAPEPLPADPPI